MLAALNNLRKKPDRLLNRKAARGGIKTLPDFQTLVVQDDIDVVLVEAKAHAIRIGGDQTLAELVSVDLYSRRLSIHANGISMAGKVKITVYVSGLKYLMVKGNSELYSAGVLRTPLLILATKGNCRISVRTNGIIRVDKHFSYELMYSRNQATWQQTDRYLS